jgi:hypothetical protein
MGKWWIITLHDTNDGSGKFVADLLVYIRSVVDFSHIIIGGVEGGGVGIREISPDRRYIYYTMDSLLPLIRKVVQFAWCDIFCFTSKDDIPTNDLWTLEYPSIIMSTIVSLRIIDGGEIEIFTQSEQLYQSVMNRYPEAQYHYSSLEEWTYPE